MLRKIAQFIVRKKFWFIAGFLALTVAMACCMPFVGVNYDAASYLPKDSATSKGLEVLHAEFGDDGTASVMVKGKSLYEALSFKRELEGIEGVKSVMWLDSVVGQMKPGFITEEDFWNTLLPSMLPNLPEAQRAQLDAFYKEGAALYQVMFLNPDAHAVTTDAVRAIRELNGGDVYVTGQAVSALSNAEVVMGETLKAMLILIPIILVILLLATSSFLEPLVFLIVIGISVVLNMGSNLMFGSVSYMTQGVAAILQLALAMDYSIYLLHRFKQEKTAGYEPAEAMTRALTKALSPLSASSLTTIAGFVALMFMRYTIGLDMGLVLAKGILFSLLTVFLFMPGLILATHKLVAKAEHKTFNLSFNGFSKVLKKTRFVVPALLILLIIPCAVFQSMNTFTYGDEASTSSAGSRLSEDRNAIAEVFGATNNYVILIPKEQADAEKPLSEALLALKAEDGTPYVTSVQSYTLVAEQAEQAGIELPPEAAAQFLGENYRRLVLNLNAPEESEFTEAAVAAVQRVTAEYANESFHIGGSPSALDIKGVVEVDFTIVNILSIVFVLAILLVTFRSLLLPLILVFVIEGSIWINMIIPYLFGQPMVFIGYMIVTAVQLGATIDYGILLANRYLENRRTMDKFDAVRMALNQSYQTILTSGGILCAAGFVIGLASSMPAVSVLGMAIGRGALASVALVLVLLPQLLMLLDPAIRATTWRGRKNMLPAGSAPPAPEPGAVNTPPTAEAPAEQTNAESETPVTAGKSPDGADEP